MRETNIEEEERTWERMQGREWQSVGKEEGGRRRRWEWARGRNGKKEEGSGRKREAGRMRNDIYRRRQSLVSVTSGGSGAHLSVFSKSTLSFQLIVFCSLFSSFTLSSLALCLSDCVTVCPQAPAAASSVSVLYTDSVYSENTNTL